MKREKEMELFPEVASDVSIFSDASNSDCGSVFSDEPTTSELLEHMSFSGLPLYLDLYKFKMDFRRG